MHYLVDFVFIIFAVLLWNCRFCDFTYLFCGSRLSHRWRWITNLNIAELHILKWFSPFSLYWQHQICYFKWNSILLCFFCSLWILISLYLPYMRSISSRFDIVGHFEKNMMLPVPKKIEYISKAKKDRMVRFLTFDKRKICYFATLLFYIECYNYFYSVL